MAATWGPGSSQHPPCPGTPAAAQPRWWLLQGQTDALLSHTATLVPVGTGCAVRWCKTCSGMLRTEDMHLTGLKLGSVDRLKVLRLERAVDATTKERVPAKMHLHFHPGHKGS